MAERMIHKCNCRVCREPFFENGERTYNINLHHKFYIHGREPWDYPEWALEFLHEGCHNYMHNHLDFKIYTEAEFKEKEAELKNFYTNDFTLID
jgi:5-methylcytosine-specific restriction endonuclease McrA